MISFRIFKGGIVPGYLKEKLDSIPVCSDKVVCLLDKMERGLRAGIVDQFESFICVMEEFATDNNDIVVTKLTEDIRSIINEPTVKQSSSTNHEIPGRSVFILFIHGYFIGLQIFTQEALLIQEVATGGPQFPKILYKIVQSLKIWRRL